MPSDEELRNQSPGGDAVIIPDGIVLPVEREHFAQFVSGILGKPQSRDRIFRGQFLLSYDDVINTYRLLEQRIHQQNEAVLIQFVVSINYSDDSSVRLNSLQEFESYTEIEPLRCVGATLSWIYLVKFPQKEAAEKQQVDLSFQVDPHFDLDDGTFPPRASYRFFASGLYSRGVHLSVKFTERTWGNDIYSLLNGHVGKFIHRPKGSRGWLSKHSGSIGVTVFLAIVMGGIIGAYFSSTNFVVENRSIYAKSFSSNIDSSDILSVKIDYLANILLGGTWAQFFAVLLAFGVATLVIAAFLGIWVAASADNEPENFILLSEKSKNYKEAYDKKIKRDWAMFYVSIFVSILIGVFSNIIFSNFFSTITL